MKMSVCGIPPEERQALNKPEQNEELSPKCFHTVAEALGSAGQSTWPRGGADRASQGRNTAPGRKHLRRTADITLTRGTDPSGQKGHKTSATGEGKDRQRGQGPAG